MPAASSRFLTASLAVSALVPSSMILFSAEGIGAAVSITGFAGASAFCTSFTFSLTFTAADVLFSSLP